MIIRIDGVDIQAETMIELTDADWFWLASEENEKLAINWDLEEGEEEEVLCSS